jgi:hypothetical protein
MGSTIFPPPPPEKIRRPCVIEGGSPHAEGLVDPKVLANFFDF